MSEKIQNRYRLLFELRLLHHYWLDEGETLFDALSKEQQEKRLESYDSRRFFVIAPIAASIKILNGLSAVYKTTPLGYFVAVPDKVVVPAETMFEFAVTVCDADFFNYTAFTLRSQEIYEIFCSGEEKIYRFKENVPVISNLTGTKQNNTFFLLRRYTTGVEIDGKVKSISIEDGKLKHLISDQEDADSQEIFADADKAPVYVKQEDFSTSLLSLSNHNGILSEVIPDDVFAIIRLQARPNRPDNDNDKFSLIDAAG